MTLQQALKTGKKFTRPDRQLLWLNDRQEFMYTLYGANFFYQFNYEDILADDWTVEETKVSVGRTDLEALSYGNVILIDELCARLGL